MKRSHAETAEYEDNVQPEQATVEKRNCFVLSCYFILIYLKLGLLNHQL